MAFVRLWHMLALSRTPHHLGGSKEIFAVGFAACGCKSHSKKKTWAAYGGEESGI